MRETVYLTNISLPEFSIQVSESSSVANEKEIGRRRRRRQLGREEEKMRRIHYKRLKRAFSKAGVNMVTRSGTKLKDLLCSANTTKHDPVKKPGIYEIQCPCSEKSKYVGQTARSIITRGKEHGSAANRGNWSHSGISAHKEFCKEEIDWTTPKVIATKTNKNKKRLNYELKVREALEICRRGCGPGQGLNKDFGAYVKTTMWNPVFHQMDRD